MGFWSSLPRLRSCSRRFVYSTSRRSRSTEFGTTEAGVTSHVFPSNSSRLRNPIFLSLLGISAGTVALQSQPSLAFYSCLYNDTKVSQSLESEFVYSLIFYRFSLVTKQKIRLVSLLLFSMLILHHICLNYRLLCLRMKGWRLMILVRTLVIFWNSFLMYRFQVRVYYVSLFSIGNIWDVFIWDNKF
jgi:hypothetical protein